MAALDDAAIESLIVARWPRRRRRPARLGRHRPRCPRSSVASAADDIRGGDRRAQAGRSRSPSSSASPSTARPASTPAPTAGGPDAAAERSSRRLRSDRCSAPCWRATSTPSGSASGVRPRSPSSTPAPGPARSPGRSVAAGRRAWQRCSYVAVELSAAQRALHPAEVESRADLPGRPVRRRHRRQRAARQPPVPAVRVRRGVARGVRRRHRRRRSPRSCRHRSTRDPPRCRQAPAPRLAGAAARRRRRLDRRRSFAAPPRPAAGHRLRGGRRRPRWRHGRGGSGCARTATTTAVTTTSPIRASQDITVEIALDQFPEPGGVCTQAQFLQRWGIDELVDRG